MAKIFGDRIIVAIDVGTTKICVIVAQSLNNEQVAVLGIGKAPSDGLKKGVVVDVAKTIHSIKTAVKEAELMAGIDIESAYIGISGGHIHSINSHGVVPIKKGEIRQTDIDAVVDAAKAIPIPEGQQILHALPQYFILDSCDKVQSPLGMHGVRLEVNAHIILGSIASVQNLVRCCELAGVKVKDIILEQLASAQAVLSADERELGVAVLDIGGGTSDLALYQYGNIRHTMVLPVAGNHFTNDLAIGLRTTVKEAERIKVEYGSVLLETAAEPLCIDAEMVHGKQRRSITKQEITQILYPRAQEIIQLIHEEITKKKLQALMPSGLVITGGGSLLHGIVDLAQQIFTMPVRIGYPRVNIDTPESIVNPKYATSYGLILHALEQKNSVMLSNQDSSVSNRIMSRMKTWISDFF